MNQYKLTRILPVLPILVVIVGLLFVAVIYPKEVDANDLTGSVNIENELITIRLDDAYSFEKFYDYTLEYENQTLKIYIRKSPIIGKNWPRTLEIKNSYQDLKSIKIMGSSSNQTIYSK